MERYLVISTDCHAGLPPGGYRAYLDPQHRERFDAGMKLQLAMAKESRKTLLVEEFNEKWRQGHEQLLAGAWMKIGGMIVALTAFGIVFYRWYQVSETGRIPAD